MELTSDCVEYRSDNAGAPASTGKGGDMTATVAPSRLPRVWAKLAVGAGAVFVTMLISRLAAFTIGQELLSGKHLNASLSDSGALLRNTAAAISPFVAVFFVIAPLTMLRPASWSGHVVQYLPSTWRLRRVDA
jgi:hypothetical protein